MDKKQYQLLNDLSSPIPMKPGVPEKQDGDYVRKGTCSIFVFTEPLSSWRHVSVSERRTKIDWANQIRELLDIHYPVAKIIRLVMDNLNTHSIRNSGKLKSVDWQFTTDSARIKLKKT